MPPGYESGFDVAHFLSFTGNVEAKTATAALLLNRRNKAWTGWTMRAAIGRLQGAEPAWLPAHMVFENYCSESLEPGGIAKTVTVPGRQGPMHAYQATTRDRDYNFAACGIVLPWSRSNPNTSVRHLFGKTALVGAYRTPELRYRLLHALTSKDSAQSYNEIVGKVEDDRMDYDAIIANIAALAALGIVQTIIKADGNIVRLHPGHRRAIKVLLGRLHILQTVPASVDRFCAEGLAMIAQPKEDHTGRTPLWEIFAKAKRFSSLKQTQEIGGDEILERVHRAIASGAHDAHTIRDRLEAGGHTFDKLSVYLYLKRLVDAGRVEWQHVLLDSSPTGAKKRVRHYQVKPEV